MVTTSICKVIRSNWTDKSNFRRKIWVEEIGPAVFVALIFSDEKLIPFRENKMRENTMKIADLGRILCDWYCTTNIIDSIFRIWRLVFEVIFPMSSILINTKRCWSNLFEVSFDTLFQRWTHRWTYKLKCWWWVLIGATAWVNAMINDHYGNYEQSQILNRWFEKNS